MPPGNALNYLSDIDFSESIIIGSIKELSCNSAAGPDGFPSSLLINFAAELAPVLIYIYMCSPNHQLIAFFDQH